ncbi:cutinase family protein [Leucobacter salsicius]|uniref:cutinase family protein n=1 Tax=Leucobacter salsicius TaxID=664638 RepID=UPI0012F871F7|nr:cutinase family protein [Leucobacter salsicius]
MTPRQQKETTVPHASSRPAHRLARAAIAAVFFAVTLAGCAAPADPGVARDALQEAAQAPAPEHEAKADEAEAEPLELEPLECLPYLVITARGTGEPHRGQLLSPVSRAIAEARPDQAVRTDLDYPADTDINGGASLGVRTLVTMLNLQAQTCPEQKFVLLGYSQGAMVVGDALSEPAARFVGTKADELRPEAAAAVSAIVFYGDPRFVGAEPFNDGSYDETRDGLLPRPAGSLEEFADRLRDYCVSDDFICQATTAGLDEAGHVEYFDNGMQQDGAAFAITQLAPLTKTAQDAKKSGETQPADKGAPDAPKSDDPATE